MTDPTPADPTAVAAVTVAPSIPDPSIARNVDPDAETPPAPAESRWVRFVGDGEVIVGDVGRWMVDEVKQVPGWLADRLLHHSLFAPAAPPAPEPATATAENATDAAEPAADAVDPAGSDTKTSRRRATPTTN